VTAGLRERPAPPPAPAHQPPNGGAPARRAVIRWAWRLFRREWRQQFLVLSLITAALAAIVVGSAVATNTPPPANTGFGSATDMASFAGNDPHLAAGIAGIRHRFGTAEVIEDQTLHVPGSVTSFSLRAQSPAGPFGQPMLSLVSGHFPAGPGQVALTASLARDLGLRTGGIWHLGGTARRVTGIVQNPQDLVDEFALVAPGQVIRPTQVTVLFDAPGVQPDRIGPNVQSQSSAVVPNAINPETILLALATVGMLLIALVGVGGFTVLAQRRLRSLGLLGSLGATDRNIRLVVRANGVVVGVAGALLGTALGIAAWLAYRPRVEVSAHHLIAAFALPWAVIGPAMGLAVLATYFAASRPAKAVSRVPVVAALSGRPAPPRKVRRSAIPGVAAVVAAFILLGLSAAGGGQDNGKLLELVLGFVALVAGMILLSPMCLTLLARLAPRTPVAVRLALRDLSRYRARSGSALGAISLSILIAVVVTVGAAGRFSNVLDYAGPNMDPDQVVIHTPDWYPGPAAPGSNPAAVGSARAAAQTAAARRIAAAVGARRMLELDGTTATLQHAAAGRGWSGPVYVATPALLGEFGISPGQVSPSADVLTMRPGLAGISRMQLIYYDNLGQPVTAGPGPGSGPPPQDSFPCPKSNCLASPSIQTVSALPSGTSAPNTVITEHAMRALGLSPFLSGWLVQAAHPPTAAQISNARTAAAAAGLTIETRSSIPSITAITGWATAAGIALALCILAMSIGLIRSETAGDLRILTATGASAPTRRTISAATAGTLGLTGALLGTAGGYLATFAWYRSSPQDGLSALASVPVWNLVIIVAGLPLAAAAAGWLLAGREPGAIARRPIE
jgi:putative ABC transport system permease protein